MSTAEPVAFALPAGRSLGGVTSWTLDLAARLSADRTVRLFEHPNSRDDLVIAARDSHGAVELVPVDDLAPPNNILVSDGDVGGFAGRYRYPAPQILVPNWSWGTYAAACSVLAGDGGASKIISFVHADGPDYYDWATYYESAITRFVAVSQEIGDELARRIPHRTHDISVLPYPVDPHDDPPDRGARIGPLRIAYAGRISRVQKRILDVVEVGHLLESHNVDVEIRIIGGGPDEAALRDAVESLKPLHKVRIVLEPPIDSTRMPEVWRWADVCLLTSEYEGTSISMLEAMAAGAVPVVTRVSGTDAMIDHERTGLLAAIGDTQRLAEHLARLAEDRSALQRLSRAAHRTIVLRGGTAAYDDRLRTLMDETAAAPPRMLNPDVALLPGRRHARLRDVVAAVRGDQHAIKRVAYRLGAMRATRPILRLRPQVERRRADLRRR